MTTQPAGTPAVRGGEPPAAVKVTNPVFATLLRSPLHGAVDKAFVLLHLTGRKTGRRYSIVVARHELDGVLTVMTNSPWRVNARGGADAEVTSDGRTWRARAELVEDPDAVAAAYRAEIERIGWQRAPRRIGIKLAVDRAPTHEELVDAVHRDHLSLIRLRPA
jgi:hypothetical protein